MLRAFLPIPYQIEVTRLRQTEFSRLRRQLDELHLAWAAEWRARQSDFKIENVRFAHDPVWDKRFFSIQAAHDGQIFFWRVSGAFVGWGAASV